MPGAQCKDCGHKLKDGRRRYCAPGSGCKADPHPHLRAVEDGETGEPVRVAPRKLSIVEAVEKGTELELMMAMRARVAEAVQNPNCPPRDLAALTKRLHEISRDIAALEAQEHEEAEGAANTPDEEWDEEVI